MCKGPQGTGRRRREVGCIPLGMQNQLSAGGGTPRGHTLSAGAPRAHASRGSQTPVHEGGAVREQGVGLWLSKKRPDFVESSQQPGGQDTWQV